MTFCASGHGHSHVQGVSKAACFGLVSGKGKLQQKVCFCPSLFQVPTCAMYLIPWSLISY